MEKLALEAYRSWRNAWLLGAAILLLVPFGWGCSAENGESIANGEVESISQERLLELSQGSEPVVILDVRSESEFASGHVPGAVNIPFDQLSTRLSEVETDGSVVVYCESGRRAGFALETLNEAGVGRLGHLEGDMKGWREAQQTVER